MGDSNLWSSPGGGGGGGLSSAWAIIQPPFGTSPTASGSDTLTFTSSDGSITITGNSGAKSIDFSGLAYTAPTSTTAQLYNNFGTCTNLQTIYEIVGKKMYVQFQGTSGTLVSATFSITLPASKTVNTTIYSSGQVVLGTFHRGVPTQSTPANSNGPWPIFYDTANSIITVAISYAASTGILVNNTNTTSFMSNSQLFWGHFSVWIN